MAPLPWWAVVLLQVGQGYLLCRYLTPSPPPSAPPPSPPAAPNAESLWRRGWAARTGTYGLCTPQERGELHFNSEANSFVGCDGRAWSKLAFCCAPERPTAPALALIALSPQEDPNKLLVSWTPPAPRGSPVVSYSLYLAGGELRGEAQIREAMLSHRGSAVCEGPHLDCTISSLNTSAPHTLWLVAHSPGGSSEPSPAATLRPAPQPVSLTATDNGDCSFGADDKLMLRFNTPTNRPLAEASAGGKGERPLALEPDAVTTLLGFSSDVGPMRGNALFSNAYIYIYIYIYTPPPREPPP